MVLQPQARIEKTVHEVKTHWLSGKEMFRLVKKRSYWHSSGTHHYLFPWKSAIVKSVSYYQLSPLFLNDSRICFKTLKNVQIFNISINHSSLLVKFPFLVEISY